MFLKILNSSPDKDQNMKNVDTAPKIIGIYTSLALARL